MSFKVFIYHDSERKPEIRRFELEENVSSRFTCLLEKLSEVFPSLNGQTFSVYWKDEEGDEITVASDDDLAVALKVMDAEPYKLYIRMKPQHGPAPRQPFTREEYKDVHPGVICDGCNEVIRGYRFKCIQCQDYDLCSCCEDKELHNNHDMIRIPPPSFWSELCKEGLEFVNAFMQSHCARNDSSGIKREGIFDTYCGSTKQTSANSCKENDKASPSSGPSDIKQEQKIDQEKYNSTRPPSSATEKKDEKTQDGCHGQREEKGASLYPELQNEDELHLDHRISHALKMLQNMGFANEGGWLTQLLKTVDGDIGKVFDVLRPVNNST